MGFPTMWLYAQTDQSLCCSLRYSMTVKLLILHHLEFLSLKGGYTGSSESTLVKMPHCWKSHVTAQIYFALKHFMLGHRRIMRFYLWYTNGFCLLVWYNKLGIVHCTYLGVSGYIVEEILYSFVWRPFLPFKTNSVHPDEMQHNAAFHLGLHCLLKYPFRGFPNTKG